LGSRPLALRSVAGQAGSLAQAIGPRKYWLVVKEFKAFSEDGMAFAGRPVERRLNHATVLGCSLSTE
jgi:hypothetical protein